MTPILPGLVGRRLMQVASGRMKTEPVLVLQGPRTVGKSTLLKDLASRFGKDVIDLDSLATRDAVAADPALFVGGPSPIFIDEFQHAPVVLEAIKAELNRDPRPGRFVITGSTQYSAGPTISRSLAGRAHVIAMRPLSQTEISGTKSQFGRILLENPMALVSAVPSTTGRQEYIRRVVAGGFPIALRRSTDNERSRWFDDYLESVVERDVLEVARVRQRRLLPEMVRRFAAQSGQVLNISRIAGEIGLEKSTAENYAKLLESVFLVQRVPAWGRTLASGVAASPKIYTADSGLAARLMRLTPAKLSAASAPALAQFGHLLETFVAGEIFKHLDWLDTPTSVGHWRTHGGDEVDLVIEQPDGKIVALEVKAGPRVPGDSLGPMMRLSKRLGSDFLAGVVIYTGARSYSFADGIYVVSADRLWTMPPK